eukprot:RCo019735
MPVKLPLRLSVQSFGLPSSGQPRGTPPGDSPYVKLPPVVDMSEVIPSFLYLGCHDDALDSGKLERAQVSHVLCVAGELSEEEQATGAPARHRMVVPMEDTSEEDVTRWFQSCFDFIEEARHDHGRILVHCNKGISRAPTIVIGYLIQYCDLTVQAALKFVKRRRSIVNPRLSFLLALDDLSSEHNGIAHQLGTGTSPTSPPLEALMARLKISSPVLAPPSPSPPPGGRSPSSASGTPRQQPQQPQQSQGHPSPVLSLEITSPLATPCAVRRQNSFGILRGVAK